MKLNDITVLMTGAGAPGAPGIIKSLRLVRERAIRVIGVDCNLAESIGIGMVDKSYQIPMADSENFIDEVLAIAKTENVDVIIPLVTKELFVFAKSKAIFEAEGIKVSVSELTALQVVNNKFQLMDFCEKNNIPSPEFYLIKTKADFIKKAKVLGFPQKTICFKPPVSNGLRGFRIVNNTKDRMQSLLNEKPNNVYIGYDEFLQMVDDAGFCPELLLMEYLPGAEYSVDALADKGNCLEIIPRRRDKIKMGISFVGTVEKNEQIRLFSKQIIEGLKLEGNIGFQFKLDNEGVPKIMESNPRVQGTIVLCTAAGFNMVYNAVKVLLGEKIEENMIDWETKMIRFWDEMYFNSAQEKFQLCTN